MEKIKVRVLAENPLHNFSKELQNTYLLLTAGNLELEMCESCNSFNELYKVFSTCPKYFWTLTLKIYSL